MKALLARLRKAARADPEAAQFDVASPADIEAAEELFDFGAVRRRR